MFYLEDKNSLYLLSMFLDDYDYVVGVFDSEEVANAYGVEKTIDHANNNENAVPIVIPVKHYRNTYYSNATATSTSKE